MWGREGCYHGLLPFPLNRYEGDEQFSLKRRRFGTGMAIVIVVTEVLKCFNQAPYSGKSVFVFLISPLDKLQLDPFI
jgi:hypothetical protein